MPFFSCFSPLCSFWSPSSTSSDLLCRPHGPDTRIFLSAAPWPHSHCRWWSCCAAIFIKKLSIFPPKITLTKSVIFSISWLLPFRPCGISAWPPACCKLPARFLSKFGRKIQKFYKKVSSTLKFAGRWCTFAKHWVLRCFQEHGNHLQVARIVFRFRCRRLDRRALLYSAIEKRPAGSFYKYNNNRPFDVSWMQKIFKTLPAFG